MSETLTSFEPATGAVLWTGASGDPDAQVAAARSAWAGWASKPFGVRVETLRRFANAARAKLEPFADLIARETGKPLAANAVAIASLLRCEPEKTATAVFLSAVFAALYVPLMVVWIL